jgi:hypothetical protein
MEGTMALHPAIKSVRSDRHATTEIRKPAIVHDDHIDWPNGLGTNPCSAEYRKTYDEMKSVKPDYVALEEMAPADYQRWNELDQRLLQLQATGHVGKSIRF